MSTAAFCKGPLLSAFHLSNRLPIWALFAERGVVRSPSAIMPLSVYGFDYDTSGLESWAFREVCAPLQIPPPPVLTPPSVPCSGDSAHRLFRFRMVLLSLSFPFISRHLISGSCLLISSEISFVFMCLVQRCLPERSKAFSGNVNALSRRPRVAATHTGHHQTRLVILICLRPEFKFKYQWAQTSSDYNMEQWKFRLFTFHELIDVLGFKMTWSM